MWRSDFRAVWARCRALRGAPAEIARLLEPRRDDLRQLRCRKLIVAGLATDNCVLFTAMDAYLHGYSLWVPRDCTAAESDEAKDGARRVLKARVHPGGVSRAQAARPAPR